MTRSVRPVALQDFFVQPFPDLRSRGVAIKDNVIYRPVFLVAAPGNDLAFDAVFLDVDTRRQEQAAHRDDTLHIGLSALIKPLPFRRIGGFLVRFSKHRVHETLH